ncbi:BURP domain-containing protein 3-like [Carex rostrata]
MDSFLPLLCSLLIGVVTSNAALLPAQHYWHTVLPNTHMPTAISDLLSSDTVMDSKTGTYVDVGKGGVDVNAGTGKPGATSVGVGKGGVHVVARKGTPEGATVGPGGASLNVKPKYGKPQRRLSGKSRPYYQSAATEEQLQYNRQTMLFFLEQDLHPGSKMNMQFEKTNAAAKFLPRSEAESIPFSSKKLPEIISQFSVQPGSDEEEAMKETLRECEDPVSKGEKKMCATSLESMVDFSIANLGTRNVEAVSTTVHSKNKTPKQEYTIIASGVKNLAQDKLVVCHQQPYTYAVFYCHLAKPTKGYTVKMTGKDGTVVDAVAVCHVDTSSWNPKHVAFKLLNVKPGTVPVCHFLSQDNVVFSRNN